MQALYLCLLALSVFKFQKKGVDFVCIVGNVDAGSVFVFASSECFQIPKKGCRFCVYWEC